MPAGMYCETGILTPQRFEISSTSIKIAFCSGRVRFAGVTIVARTSTSTHASKNEKKTRTRMEKDMEVPLGMAVIDGRSYNPRYNSTMIMPEN